MSEVTSLTSESIRGLGGGAHLVTVLPSAIAVLSAVVLVSSRLYPWADPIVDQQGKPVAEGIDSVVYSLGHAGAAGAVVLTLTVLVGAILLRPFQIALVQSLEGYWRAGRLSQLAVGRHMSRRRVAEVRKLARTVGTGEYTAEAVVAAARRQRQTAALRERARSKLSRYPANGEHTMPTSLGNILRMAETSAGERYGFSTVYMFPRLYPFLSQPLDAEYREQTNLLDSSAAFALLFGALTLLTAPMVWRLDGWSVLPLVAASIAALSYRGACTAAEHVAQQQCVAFDLHRFQMLRQMRQLLPTTGEQELRENQSLTEAIKGDTLHLRQMRYLDITDKPPEEAAATPPASTPSGGRGEALPALAPPAGTGIDSEGVPGGDADFPSGPDDHGEGQTDP
jgi:hypothetical protein